MFEKSVINVLILYDQQLLAEGLRAILSNQKEINVLGTLKNNSSWNESISEYNADILIVELCHLHPVQVNHIKQIHESFPNLGLLVLSEIIAHKQLDELMPHIGGFMLRTCSAKKTVFAIHEIFAGGKYICAKAIDFIFGCNNGCSKNVEFDLTLREKEILANWLTSKDNSELAETLNISHSTVRTHLKNIRQKLGPVTHIQLMTYACRENVIQGNFKPVCKNCMLFCHEQ
ncbi:response regulator transcription factor [Mangrovibacterium lignilyticum]|uniref:response regulator transcription factor n=1 Tax=Mangrovibacterium lignilyticum TaxID=2668052 RepID=UPI0013D60385|nr:response regulator transcription factor [Mangrovibacterium lignilyticum]